MPSRGEAKKRQNRRRNTMRDAKKALERAYIVLFEVRRRLRISQTTTFFASLAPALYSEQERDSEVSNSEDNQRSVAAGLDEVIPSLAAQPLQHDASASLHQYQLPPAEGTAGCSQRPEAPGPSSEGQGFSHPAGPSASVQTITSALIEASHAVAAEWIFSQNPDASSNCFAQGFSSSLGANSAAEHSGGRDLAGPRSPRIAQEASQPRLEISAPSWPHQLDIARAANMLQDGTLLEKEEGTGSPHRRIGEEDSPRGSKSNTPPCVLED